MYVNSLIIRLLARAGSKDDAVFLPMSRNKKSMADYFQESASLPAHFATVFPDTPLDAAWEADK